MNALNNKVPPVILLLFFSLIVWWISSFSALEKTNPIILQALSLSTLIIALIFSISGIVSFRFAKTTANPLKPETASSLVNTGIYRISRNPMYVGFGFFILSLSIYFASPLSLLSLIVFVLYMTEFQIKPEEKSLDDLFGEEFKSYKRNVRRWL